MVFMIGREWAANLSIFIPGIFGEIVFLRDVFQIMVCWARKMVQTNFIVSFSNPRWWIIDNSSISIFSPPLSIPAKGCDYFSKTTFLQRVSRGGHLGRQECCGNELKTKRKTSTFQNIQNYWNWLIIQKVMKDKVMDFDDEKQHAFWMHTFLVHARVPPLMHFKKRAVFHHQSPSPYPS